MEKVRRGWGSSRRDEEYPKKALIPRFWCGLGGYASFLVPIIALTIILSNCRKIPSMGMGKKCFSAI